MSIVIKNGNIVGSAESAKKDILIMDGKIQKVEAGLRMDGAEVIDASGCFVFPGFIDTHTHFDTDVGTTVTADDFYTGTRAAILGGTTTVLDFAAQAKGETMQKAFNGWKERAKKSNCNYGCHMAITQWNDKLSQEMETMIQEGVTSFKMYMVYPALRVEDDSAYEALKRARELNVLIGMHCENYHLLLALIKEQKEKGIYGPMGHCLSRPSIVEADGVARYLRIARLAKSPAYVVHLSTKEGLSEALMARKRGQEVYIETCPQYLVLTVKQYLEPDAEKYVMSPPLRPRGNPAALWKGLGKNQIQTIGTDHCSFTMAQKAMGKDDFTKIPNGGAGVQNRAALYYTFGVLKKRVSINQMAAQLSENGAKLFGMYPKKGCIKEGSDGDIVIWDPSFSESISYKNLAHNCDNSPYEGINTFGRARDVILNGEHVVKNGELIKTYRGKYVKRETKMPV